MYLSFNSLVFIFIQQKSYSGLYLLLSLFVKYFVMNITAIRMTHHHEICAF